MGHLNDDNKLNNNTMEAIGIILFMIMYALLGIYSFPFILFFFPTPFIYLGTKSGPIHGIIGITIVSILVGLISDIYSGVFLFELFMPITTVIIFEFKNRKRPLEILLYSTVIFFVSSLLLYGLMQDVTGVSLISQMEEIFNQVLNTNMDLLKESGLTNYEMLKAKNLLETGYSYILSILPSILIMVSMFIAYSNYYLSVLALRKSGIGIVTIPRFSIFKLPNNIIPGIIIMFLGVYLMKGFDLLYYDSVVINLVVLIWFMFSIQGLSVIDFIMLKFKFRLFLRIILIVLITVFVPAGTIIALIGFGDVLFDFRKLKRLKS